MGNEYYIPKSQPYSAEKPSELLLTTLKKLKTNPNQSLEQKLLVFLKKDFDFRI